MIRITRLASVLIAAIFVVGSHAGGFGQTPEPRIALVIGNAKYQAGELLNAANDAGAVAQSLTSAGFDVTGIANLDAEQMRRAIPRFPG